MLELHSKGACLHNEHYLQRNCCVCIIWNNCSSGTQDTDRATGVKLANGHFLEMHAAEMGEEKKLLFSNEACFQLCELQLCELAVADTDLQKIQ